ncbi:hypothetical protein GCM10017562_33370 [Streptomyces roseofulvus]|uniref:DUF4232 domain-containing protein n=2 Tax=Streptomyces TaxID=1883 RepID=A0ABU4K3F0_9ACTN|nr:DUF4232 domain-containing protein [Streptomyces roseolus]MDX2291977.1 DUF4232 domain-containing protein [Streptomyces roseolus]
MRTTVRRLALPAAALAAALALTACQSSDQEAAPVPAPAQPTQTTPRATPTQAPATPTTAPTTAPATTAPRRTTAPPATSSAPAPRPTTAGNDKGDDGAGHDDAGTLRPCTAGDVKVVASKVTRPLNHLALTVTNTGARPCDAVGAPLVGFDHSQAPIRIVEESKPQAVVRLAPGESAYASLILTGEPGEDTHGMTVRTIKVNLTADSMVTVTAPEGTYVDDGAAVSYWQREFEDALQF